MFTQIDVNQTEFLRKRIQKMREESVDKVESKKKTADLLSTVLVVLIRMASFFGAQYYIFVKLSVEPFTVWESLVIYLGISAVISLFKKST